MKKTAGLTLMELMIATFILSVGVLAAVGSFKYITKSIQYSKSRTLSSNLAQEQVEKLKNLPYYTLLVTTATNPGGDTRFIPALNYDIGNYPAQTIIEGGIAFTRATRVDYVYQNGSAITAVPWSNDDTALKQITVYVIWRDGQEWKYQQLQNLLANPAAIPLTAAAAGWVRIAPAGTVGILNARVQIIDNANWYANASASGDYRFSVSPGSYTVQASSEGYYTATTNGYLNFTSGNTTPYNFTLSAISNGTVSGTVYIADHLLISQVVGSSGTTSPAPEWVEIYNPSSFTWTLATGPASPVIDLVYDRLGAGGPQTIVMNYHNLTIPASSYYLFANVSSVTVGGVTRAADAEFDPSTPNVIKIDADSGVNNAAGIELAWHTSGTPIDAVGWQTNDGSPHPPPFWEGTALNQPTGLEEGEQYIRMTSPASLNSVLGRAYDTNNNSLNFMVLTLNSILAPYNVAAGAKAAIAATPAAGALVNLNDLLGNSATCNSAGAFSLTVATGTWTMAISSAASAGMTYYAQISTVTVQTGVSTSVPNGITSPSWGSVSNNSVTLLRNTTTYAFISGRVYSNTGTGLTGIRMTDGNGHIVNTSAGGAYLLLASTGAIQLTANPNDSVMNRAYTTQELSLTLSPGVLVDNQNFTLELSGVIKGYFQTSSNTPLPGRVAIATKTDGSDSAQAVSDSTGYFYMQNLSTGSYSVSPSLDSIEVASPSSLPVLLASTGTTNSVSTFTVTSGIAEITGQVLSSTQPITTGALIVASSATIAGSLPPPQYGATGATCNPCVYSVSSDATGTYSLQVRSSTTPYKVYGWYSTVTPSAATVVKSNLYTVTVSTPGQIISQNITW